MPEVSPQGPIILLVEDEPATSKAMQCLLSHYGYAVRACGSVLETMSALRTPPAVAIVDLHLPDGTGGRVIELIRSRKMMTRVIVTTGSRDRGELAAVAKFKPDMILTKPVDFMRLLDCIRQSELSKAA